MERRKERYCRRVGSHLHSSIRYISSKCHYTHISHLTNNELIYGTVSFSVELPYVFGDVWQEISTEYKLSNLYSLTFFPYHHAARGIFLDWNLLIWHLVVLDLMLDHKTNFKSVLIVSSSYCLSAMRIA